MGASIAARHLTLPVQTLLIDMLGMLVPIRLKVDNTQAISAIKKGYSKKLRCLSRTHRCSIGAMHERYSDPEVCMEVVYEPTATHKCDFFTKALNPGPFALARSRA